jgi:putative tryptophan/tyrosine transport system permease protein
MIYAILPILYNVLELGLIYSLTVLSVHLTSCIIAFDDLAIEGCFAFGGALTAVCLINQINPVSALVISLIGGALIGLSTGILHTKFGINNLIVGIVITTALFSVNLKLAGANVVLGENTTIFDLCSFVTGGSHIPLLLVIAILLLWGINLFLKTEIGTLLTVVGANPQMLVLLGKNQHQYKIGGLVIAHAITGLAGSLFVQHIGLFSISGSIGTLVTALAGLIIGQTLCRKGLLGILIGAICYQIIIALTIELYIDPAWNKLITALLVIILIAARKWKR